MQAAVCASGSSESSDEFLGYAEFHSAYDCHARTPPSALSYRHRRDRSHQRCGRGRASHPVGAVAPVARAGGSLRHAVVAARRARPALHPGGRASAGAGAADARGAAGRRARLAAYSGRYPRHPAVGSRMPHLLRMADAGARRLSSALARCRGRSGLGLSPRPAHAAEQGQGRCGDRRVAPARAAVGFAAAVSLRNSASAATWPCPVCEAQRARR